VRAGDVETDGRLHPALVAGTVQSQPRPERVRRRLCGCLDVGCTQGGSDRLRLAVAVGVLEVAEVRCTPVDALVTMRRSA